MCSIRISMIPGASQVHIPNVDKIVHFGFFFILTILLYHEITRQLSHPASRLITGLVIFVMASLYGGTIELLQKYIFTYRSAEWLDFLADTLGALTALMLIIVYYYWGQSRRPVTHA